MLERLRFIRNNDGKGYAEAIQRQAKVYTQLRQEMTKVAIEVLDVDEITFRQSHEEAQKSPHIAKALAYDEDTARLRVEPRQTLTRSKDDYKKMLLDKTRMEEAMYKKLASMQAKNSAEANFFNMVEHTRVMDLMFIKYRVRITELLQAVKDFDLENDPEIKAMFAASNKVKENIRSEQAKKIQNLLTPKQQREIVTLCQQAGAPLQIQTDAAGVMNYNNFLTIFTVMLRL